MKPSVHLAAMVTASSLVIAVHSADAQESPANPTAKQKAPQSAVIVVTGTRAALESAEDFKKNAGVLVDAISADDIGALPDESIADSLVRIPGLTANDSEDGFGEVSVRGLGPDLTNTTYNGRVLPSPRFDSRRLNLGDLPSEGIARAFVQKTAAASTIEGGLGGTIGLQSVHPLETRRRGLSLVGRVMTDDVSQKIKGVYGYKPVGYRGEVSYIGRPAHNLGISFSYAHIQQTNARPSTQLVNYQERPESSDPNAPVDFIPDNAGINMGANNQNRDSVLAMVQWRPIHGLTASLDGYYINSTSGSHPINFIATGTAANSGDPSVLETEDGVVRVYQGNTGRYRETIHAGSTRTLQYEGGFNLKWNDGGPMAVNLDLAWAQAKLDGTNIGATIFTDGANAKDQVRPFGYDTSDEKHITLDFGPQSADDYQLASINFNHPNLTDTVKSARLDFRYRERLLIFGSSEFGMRVNGRVKDNRPDGDSYGFGPLPKHPDLDDSYLYASQNPLLRAADYFGGAGSVSFPLFDINKVLALTEDPNAVLNTHPVNDITGRSRITENTMALYYQGNIKVGQRLNGNIGVRYFTTDEIVEGFATKKNAPVTALKIKHHYDYWLPALNLRYALTHTLAVRAALSKTISRPVFGAMRIGSAVDYSSLEPGDTIGRGNPDLKPFTSKNADLALEWYPSRGASFGIQGFYKEVNNFIINQSVASDVTLPDGSTIPVTINTHVNDPSKRRFYGIELIARKDFDFLPGFLRNLGARVDYSHNWTDARDLFKSVANQEVELTPNNFTPWIVNAQLYYSSRKFDAHLAYRYYAPYSRQNTNGYQSRPGGTLDLTASAVLRRGVRVIGTIRNLTNTRIYSTLVDYRRPDSYGMPRNVIYVGRSFTIGLRAKL